MSKQDLLFRGKQVSKSFFMTVAVRRDILSLFDLACESLNINNLETCLPRKKKSCFDVTIFPSLSISLARFCTPPEVKFHVFRRLKRGEGKSISIKFFSLLLSGYCVGSNKQIKKICHIHFKGY